MSPAPLSPASYNVPVSRVVVILALLAAIACGGSQTSAPDTVDLTGSWVGALPLHMPGEDWSSATLVLDQRGAAITGEMTSRNGARYPLTGTTSGSGATLDVGGLPGSSTCGAIRLSVTELTFASGHVSRMSGFATGSCYGTVDGAFHLDRQ